ncbi:MAG: zinc-dependent metalloprotease family protein [Chitinophagales bacterium]
MKDLSIHMNLIPNNDTLIFIGTDSYSNDDGGAMLGQNQIVCNNRIGSANYDIGHVFSTGGGGVAYLGCVCVNADKAKGVTGSGTPYGDGFDIDYVAHEMGHQFGANHTFNGNTGACVGNGNSSTAYGMEAEQLLWDMRDLLMPMISNRTLMIIFTEQVL